MRSYANYGRALIELELLDAQVLLSDHETWHFVLNRWPIQSHEHEEIEALHSWSRIFEVNALGVRTIPCDPDWISAADLAVQACFWELRASDVKSIKHFKERP